MSYRIVAGSIYRNGTIRTPSPPLQPEFRVSKAAIGVYAIEFEPSFSQLIAGSTTQIYQSSGQSLLDNTYIMEMSSVKAKICTGDKEGKLNDRDFTFVFVGIGTS